MTRGGRRLRTRAPLAFVLFAALCACSPENAATKQERAAAEAVERAKVETKKKLDEAFKQSTLTSGEAGHLVPGLPLCEKMEELKAWSEGQPAKCPAIDEQIAKYDAHVLRTVDFGPGRISGYELSIQSDAGEIRRWAPFGALKKGAADPSAP